MAHGVQVLIQAPRGNVETLNNDLPPSEDGVDPLKVWRTMDLAVLPVTTMMFFLSSLDRSNIGNARVAGLQEYLEITNEEFSTALIVTLVSYVLLKFPANIMFKIIGPRLLLRSMAVLWGLACALQGFIHSFIGLAACGFILGLFEGGLLPCLALYLSTFYPRRSLQFRIAIISKCLTMLVETDHWQRPHCSFRIVCRCCQIRATLSGCTGDILYRASSGNMDCQQFCATYPQSNRSRSSHGHDEYRGNSFHLAPRRAIGSFEIHDCYNHALRFSGCSSRAFSSNFGWFRREQPKAKGRAEVGIKSQGGSLQILEGGDDGIWYD
ncbi:major facilitator superfamily domain-containing protein [Amylostereum chailletii]|nr:major facilitator superfamily domain-containing protein [Amylostereum chailletii]